MTEKTYTPKISIPKTSVPKISIITATLNRRDFLPRCIESVASQDYPNKEHLIIDGGSTDGTGDILQEYAAKYSYLRFLSEKDEGLSQAFNKGLSLAGGSILGVLGDDDIYLPGAFASVATEFVSSPEVGLVSGGCALVRNDGTVWQTQAARFTNRADLIECWRYWGRTVILPAPSSFFRREVIEAVGGFEEADRYSMDYRHWIKITEKFPVRVIKPVLARFRCDDGTLSFSSADKQWAETLAISRQYWGRPGSPSFLRYLWSFWFYYELRRIKYAAQKAIQARWRRIE